MSRRRASFTPAAPLTDEEVLAAFFGQGRVREQHAPMPGCSASCCSSGLWAAVEEAEGRLRRALLLWTVVSVGTTGVVVALVWMVWRWVS